MYFSVSVCIVRHKRIWQFEIERNDANPFKCIWFEKIKALDINEFGYGRVLFMLIASSAKFLRCHSIHSSFRVRLVSCCKRVCLFCMLIFAFCGSRGTRISSVRNNGKCFLKKKPGERDYKQTEQKQKPTLLKSSKLSSRIYFAWYSGHFFFYSSFLQIER